MPEKVAGREYNSITSKLLSRKYICKKLLQSYAFDLHILTPLPESQFTDVFIFLAAVQVLPFCHRWQGDSDNTTQTQTNYNQIQPPIRNDQNKTRIKKSENLYSMKTSPLLPTAEKKIPVTVQEICRIIQGMSKYLLIPPFLVEPWFRNTAKFQLYKCQCCLFTV